MARQNIDSLEFLTHLLISLSFALSTGVGSHFLAIATGILLMALSGMFNVHRHGSINTAAILLYALTSCKLQILFAKMT